jgi:hypothetical protein
MFRLYISATCPAYRTQLHFINLMQQSLTAGKESSPLVMESEVSHSYKISKIIVLYILIFMFLDSRREDKSFWTEW